MLAGLSMGDKWVPAIAQVAHEEVLKSFGAFRPEELLELGKPLPRAPFGHYSGVCIDDKVSLQVFPHHVPAGASNDEVPARDLEACSQTDHAYEEVGLETHHPKKSVRRSDVFKVWGAQLLGDEGLLSIDSTKLAALSWTSARLARSGVCTEVLLQKVLGLWAFAFQFRRPLFSLFASAYRTGHPDGLREASFRVPGSVQQEVQLAAALACWPLLHSKPKYYRPCLVLTPLLKGQAWWHAMWAPLLHWSSSVDLHSSGIGINEPEFLISKSADEKGEGPHERHQESQCEPTLASPHFGSLALSEQLEGLLFRLARGSLRVRDLTTEGFFLDVIELYSGKAGFW